MNRVGGSGTGLGASRCVCHHRQDGARPEPHRQRADHLPPPRGALLRGQGTGPHPERPPAGPTGPRSPRPGPRRPRARREPAMPAMCPSRQRRPVRLQVRLHSAAPRAPHVFHVAGGAHRAGDTPGGRRPQQNPRAPAGHAAHDARDDSPAMLPRRLPPVGVTWHCLRLLSLHYTDTVPRAQNPSAAQGGTRLHPGLGDCIARGRWL